MVAHRIAVDDPGQTPIGSDNDVWVLIEDEKRRDLPDSLGDLAPVKDRALFGELLGDENIQILEGPSVGEAS